MGPPLLIGQRPRLHNLEIKVFYQVEAPNWIPSIGFYDIYWDGSPALSRVRVILISWLNECNDNKQLKFIYSYKWLAYHEKVFKTEILLYFKSFDFAFYLQLMMTPYH